jgi:hypothetical protein
MKKWTALSSNNEDTRWQAMSQALTEAGVANTYIPWTGNVSEMQDLSTLAQFDHVRISSRIAPQVLKHVKVQSSWTTLLGVVDGMNNTNLGWWPLCALYESFGQLLIELGQDLDKRGNVLVAGAGGAARIAIAAFFKSGFQNFIVTNFVEEEALQLVREVKARFFGLTVQWVPMERIVLLPGESSVICNCTPSVEENALLTELSYLNFLKRPGFLFDLSRSFKPSILMQEAQDANVRAISGVEIAARTDVLWAKWGFQANLDLNSYRDRLQATLA